MPGRPKCEYLSDGITESIINNLSQLPKLRVMARSTVFRYKGQAIDPCEVGRALGVRAVLTGRVLQLGDSLVIKTELVHVADGSQLWGQQFNLHLGEFLRCRKRLPGRSLRSCNAFEWRRGKRLAKRHTENPRRTNCICRDATTGTSVISRARKGNRVFRTCD